MKALISLLLAGVLLTGCIFVDSAKAAVAIFTFEATDDEDSSMEILSVEDNTTTFHIKTTKTTVLAALFEFGLIEGLQDDEADFYVVKVIDGLAVSDNAKWVLHIDGEASPDSIRSMEIDFDKVYSFVYTKN